MLCSVVQMNWGWICAKRFHVLLCDLPSTSQGHKGEQPWGSTWASAQYIPHNPKDASAGTVLGISPLDRLNSWEHITWALSSSQDGLQVGWAAGSSWVQTKPSLSRLVTGSRNGVGKADSLDFLPINGDMTSPYIIYADISQTEKWIFFFTLPTICHSLQTVLPLSPNYRISGNGLATQQWFTQL